MSSWRRGARAIGLAVVALALLVSAVAHATTDKSQFEIGVAAYDAGQYEQAHGEFTSMLDGANSECEKLPAGTHPCRLADRTYLTRAYAYDGAALLILKRVPEANEAIKKAYRSDPSYQPSPANFSAEVIRHFGEVRDSIATELEAQLTKEAKDKRELALARQKAIDDYNTWLQELEQMAAQDRVVRENSRVTAMLPFGVGQYQNRDVRLGTFFLVSELVTGSGTIATAIVQAYFVGQHGNPNVQAASAVSANNTNIQAASTVSAILFTVWATTAIGGIVQAQAAFLPERTVTRKRPTPPPPAIRPTFSVLPGGGTAGVIGTF